MGGLLDGPLVAGTFNEAVGCIVGPDVELMVGLLEMLLVPSPEETMVGLDVGAAVGIPEGF